MFSFSKRKKQKNDRKIQELNIQNQTNKRSSNLIEKSLSKNLEVIKQKTGNSSDIVIRQLKICHNSKMKIAILYVKGLVDNQSVNDFVIESIINNQNLSQKLKPHDVLEVLTEDVVAVGGIKVVSDWEKLFTALMSGETITLIEGINKGICASTHGGQRRSVQESTTNVSIRGSKEAFNESIETNTAMVRRIINNTDLWVESITIGKMTKTEVSIMYLNGIAKNEIIEEVRKRLKRINIEWDTFCITGTSPIYRFFSIS